MDQKNKGNYFQIKNTIFCLIYADKYSRQYPNRLEYGYREPLLMLSN